MMEIEGSKRQVIEYMERERNFYNRSFYISLIIWACGMAFSMIGGELFDISPAIRIISIFVPFGIYVFFIIGKDSTEKKVKDIIK